MLRLALVEELRRLVDGVVAGAPQPRAGARDGTAQLTADARRPERDHRPSCCATESEASGRLSAAFVVELLQWLRDQPLVGRAGLAWRCSARSRRRATRPTRCCGVEHQREAADQLAIGNIITSMRLLSSIDWPLFFERVSLVEQILRDDPAGAYARDGLSDARPLPAFGRAAGQGSRSSRSSDVAQRRGRARARRRSSTTRTTIARHHVGYYLISRGRFRLEQDLRLPAERCASGSRASSSAIRRSATSARSPSTTALGVASLARLRAAGTAATPGELWLVALVVLLPVSELAISLINLVAHVAGARRGRCPSSTCATASRRRDRTMVVVPAIIDSEARVDVAPRRPRGAVPRQPRSPTCTSRCSATSPMRDAADAARTTTRSSRRRGARVDELNERHGAGSLLLLPSRAALERRASSAGWDGSASAASSPSSTGCCAARPTPASSSSTAISSILPSIRYVITLDSDTQLPMEAGRRLVGTLSHPLNRPRFDAAAAARHRRLRRAAAARQRQRRERQPHDVRAGVLRARRRRSVHDRGVRRLSGPVPRGQLRRQGHLRRRRVRAALAGRVPENTLLSHDLFEGFYARAGLVHRHRPGRRLPVATTWRSPRGSTAGCAATGRSRAGSGARCPTRAAGAVAEHAAGDRALEDPRQPAPQPDRRRRSSRCSSPGWTVLPGSRAASGRRWRCWCSRSPPTSRSARSLGSRVRGVPLREHLLRRARQPGHQRAPGVSLDRLPAAPERGDARRDRPRRCSGCW